jgi:hypothetical protein
MSYKELCPVGTKVRIIQPINSDEKGWLVVPLYATNKNFTLPDSYELLDGWAIVTRHDETSPRSRNGEAPIVVQEYIYCEFDEELWKLF